MIKKDENNIGWLDDKTSGIGELILKHKVGTIFVGIVFADSNFIIHKDYIY